MQKTQIADTLHSTNSIGSVFEVSLKALRKIVQKSELQESSIKIVHRWFQEKEKPGFEKVMKTWENIRLIRNTPPTHHQVKPKVLDALTFFGVTLPVDFTKLWDSILEKFAESLELLQEII